MTTHEILFNKRVAEVEELPNLIFIESVMGCNLRCPMCPVPKGITTMNKRSYQAMTLAIFTKIIEQISEKPRQLWLNQLGEPLLNHDLLDFVKIAKSRGHSVDFTTNGTKMTPELADALIRQGLDGITFSFDGWTKETYEQIRVGANYESVVENIRNFIRIRQELKAKTHIRIDCIVSDLTFPELDGVINFWSPDVQVNFIPLDDWAGQLPLDERFGKKRTPMASTQDRRYPCRLLWTTMAISAEGRVMYCCHDYQQRSQCSSVDERPLIDIWRDEIFRERQKHVANMIDAPPCLHCPAWKTMPEFYHDTALRQSLRLLPKRIMTGIKKRIFRR